MPPHDDFSTGARIGRILDSARASAISDAGRDFASPGDDDVWPASWPPGQGTGPPVAPAEGRSRRADLGTAPPRWDISGRAAVVVGVLALLVIGVLLILQLHAPGPGAGVPVRDPIPAAGNPAQPTAAAVQAPLGSAEPSGALGDPAVLASGTAQPSVGLLRVYVVGQVRRPGVVSVSPGARVEDAVDAAGGGTAKADLTVMNLARKVVDGERIVVPRPGEKVPVEAPVPAADNGGGSGTDGSETGGSEQAGSPAPGSPVNLNTATVADLDALPGVGPVIAGRIVAWREQNGDFKTVDDLAEVSGIGDATLARLRPLVRI